MSRFFILEAGNLTIALFFLMIAIIVSTRSFVSKSVKKFIFVATVSIFSILIMGHYMITTSRMDEVREAFNDSKDIICENRLNRKAAQSIVIKKDLGWSLDGDNFTNPEFSRVFHISRCVVK